MNAQYPELVEALEAEPSRDFVLDGEIVAFDRRGVTSFSRLQRRGRERVPVYLYVFDLLRHEGEDLRDLPLRERKARLRARASLRGPPALHPAPQRARRGDVRRGLPQGPRGHHRQARRQPLPRHPLARLAQAQVPRRAGAGDRRLHRAAGLAHRLRRAAGGPLRGRRGCSYAGKVGTGFDVATLSELGGAPAQARARLEPPFADVHPIPRGTHWVEPELVAQIGFTEWTRDGRLRHPRYLGLRDDKPAARRGARAPVVSGGDHPPGQAALPRRRDDQGRLGRLLRAVAEWMLPHVADRPLCFRCSRAASAPRASSRRTRPAHYPELDQARGGREAGRHRAARAGRRRRHARLPRRPERDHPARLASRADRLRQPDRHRVRPRPGARRRLRRRAPRRAQRGRAAARDRARAVRAGHRLEGHPRLDAARGAAPTSRTSASSPARWPRCWPGGTPTS